MRKITFATTEYEYLRSLLLSETEQKGLIKGDIMTKIFPDGERYHQLQCDVSDQNLVVIGGCTSDTSTMELYDMIYGLASKGAKSIEIICPYFAYSTMERALEKGEFVKAKARASLFSSLSLKFNNTRFKLYLFDTHTDGLIHYFDETMYPEHVYCDDLIHARLENSIRDYTVATTDLGRAKWARAYARKANVPCVVIDKDRVDGSTTKVVDMYGVIQTENVVLFDDMVRSGSSMIGAAGKYKKQGAKFIFAMSTHAVLSGDAISIMSDRNFIEKTFITNSHSTSQKVIDDEHSQFEVISIHPLIEDILIHGYVYWFLGYP